MIELTAILIALGTFTGYLVGRARGYMLGYCEAKLACNRLIEETRKVNTHV